MPTEQQQRDRARDLRRSQTKAEGLLWSLLRTKQVCGLKFRRQHKIGPFFADFACPSHRLVIELDGDYHEKIPEEDRQRQQFLQSKGWHVIRFGNDDVLNDTEAAARSIAESLGLPYTFEKRTAKMSGMMSENRPSSKHRNDKVTAIVSPHPAATASDLPPRGR